MLAYIYVIYAYTYHIHYTNSQPPPHPVPSFFRKHISLAKRHDAASPPPPPAAPHNGPHTRLQGGGGGRKITQHSTTPADIVHAANCVNIYIYMSYEADRYNMTTGSTRVRRRRAEKVCIRAQCVCRCMIYKSR